MTRAFSGGWKRVTPRLYPAAIPKRTHAPAAGREPDATKPNSGGAKASQR